MAMQHMLLMSYIDQVNLGSVFSNYINKGALIFYNMTIHKDTFQYVNLLEKSGIKSEDVDIFVLLVCTQIPGHKFKPCSEGFYWASVT